MYNKAKIIKNKMSVYLLVYIAFYFVVNCFFLGKFPLMHSDESWLSGLTRSMMSEGFGATEYFFDIFPRYPHAIKSIFHLLQMVFILVFGYSLFTVRLLSLIFGCISLVLIYRLLLKLTKSNIISFIGMIIISLDIQFVYASHFARQEIVILFIMLFGICYIVTNASKWSIKKDIVAASAIGVSIGIHPNSFIVAMVLGSIYLYYLIAYKKFRIKNLLILILTTTGFALLFVGASYIMNDNFIYDYLKYGDNLGVTVSGIMKFIAFPDYYRKLFNGFSVTYYLPDIRFQLILFAISIVTGILSLAFNKRNKLILLMILPVIAINISFIIISRYAQPYIIFIFPLCYILVFMLLSKFKKLQMIFISLLGIATLANTLMGIIPYLNNDYNDYNDYLSEIEEVVPSDAEVLANLNTEYAFEYDNLHDYRNLAYLDEKSLEDYIKQNEIEYIIYPEEMDFIYKNRPVWNVVYGNVYPYYDDMQEFLDNDCELIKDFASPYAMRILMYSQSKPWEVKIYRVLEGENS